MDNRGPNAITCPLEIMGVRHETGGTIVTLRPSAANLPAYAGKPWTPKGELEVMLPRGAPTEGFSDGSQVYLTLTADVPVQLFQKEGIETGASR